MAGLLPSSGLRTLRFRTVLLALVGSLTLLFLTGSYYSRQNSSLLSWAPTSYLNQGLERIQHGSDAYTAQRDLCWSQWFSSGTICASPPEQWLRKDKLDLVWTWKNETLEADARSPSTQANHTHSQSRPSSNATLHAASSDLLRYSLRSAQQHLHDGFATVNILTPDVPSSTSMQRSNDSQCENAYQDESSGLHIGQKPCWLKSAARYVPPRLVHHRQVACSSLEGLTGHACTESKLQNMHQATARMLATQIKGLSDICLIVSPHHVFANDVSASDFYSPLYGPAYRLTDDWQSSGTVDSNSPNTTHPIEGPLIRANRLLDLRFGTRTRRRLLDLPQPISNSTVNELYQTWPQELGSLSSQSEQDHVDLAFLSAHYTFEKYREALLWSFVIAKHDRDGDGNFSPVEARNLLRELGADESSGFAFPQVEVPIRSTRSHATVRQNLERVGLPPRLGQEDLQTSLDGDGLITPRSPVEPDGQNGEKLMDASARPKAPFCVLGRDCVAPLIDAASGRAPGASTNDVFSRLAFRSTACGDCVLVHLVQQSGSTGLSAFLPDADLDMSTAHALPNKPTYETTDFSLPALPWTAQKVKRLHMVSNMFSRYVYSIVLQEWLVTPQLSNRLEAKVGLTALESMYRSSLWSFKRHGPAAEEEQQTGSEDDWIWSRYARAWLSLRFPFPMRFEADTNEL